MKRWHEPDVGGYSQAEVQEYCVKDEVWQGFRASLKGLSTEVKLDWLRGWLETNIDMAPRRTRVQVDNYINALKRGGQLNMNLEVVR